MSILWIAIGNPLRDGDDIAHRAIDRLEGAEGADRLKVIQLTPEIAAELPGHDIVVFLDADVNVSQPRVEPLNTGPQKRGLTHVVHPFEVLQLARQFFRFKGEAYLVRLPFVEQASLPAAFPDGRQRCLPHQEFDKNMPARYS